MTRLRTRLDENLVCLYLQDDGEENKERKNRKKRVADTEIWMSTKMLVLERENNENIIAAISDKLHKNSQLMNK